jgi:hypothetical protein
MKFRRYGKIKCSKPPTSISIVAGIINRLITEKTPPCMILWDNYNITEISLWGITG